MLERQVGIHPLQLRMLACEFPQAFHIRDRGTSVPTPPLRQSGDECRQRPRFLLGGETVRIREIQRLPHGQVSVPAVGSGVISATAPAVLL